MLIWPFYETLAAGANEVSMVTCFLSIYRDTFALVANALLLPLHTIPILT